MKFIVFLTTLVITSHGFSQKGNVKRDSINKFNHSSWAIKTAPLQLSVGELSFSYEQRIFPQSSIEFTLGPTASRTGFAPLIRMWNSQDISSSSLYAKEAIGVHTSLAYKYYLLEEEGTAPVGLYVSPELKYRMYKSIYDGTSHGMGMKNGVLHQTSIRFTGGYQWAFTRVFFLDTYGGIGIGFNKATSHDILYLYDDLTQTGSTEWKSYQTTRIGFVAYIGFKIGFGGIKKDRRSTKEIYLSE